MSSRVTFPAKMGPRADFVCLSRKCQVDGQASVYELPIASTRCPVCSSKRIQRLYNQVNVSGGMARDADRMIEPAHEQARAVRESAAAGTRFNGPSFAVPVKDLGAALGRVHPAFGGARLPAGGMKATVTGAEPQWNDGIKSPPIRAGGMPRPLADSSRRDREYKIKVTKDAKGRFADAEVVKA